MAIVSRICVAAAMACSFLGPRRESRIVSTKTYSKPHAGILRVGLTFEADKGFQKTCFGGDCTKEAKNG